MNKFLFIILSLGLLQACSSVTPKIQSESQIFNNERNPKLEKIQTWRIEGRIKLKQKDQSGVLSLVWTQNFNRHQMLLSAPLGQTVFRLDLEGSEAKVTLQDGNVYWGDNAQILLQQLVGFNIPVELMKQWIKGQTATKINIFDDKGRLLSSTIDGWQLKIKEYSWAESKALGDIAMPSLIKISKDDVLLVLRISQWNINSTEAIINFDDEMPNVPLFSS